MRNVLILHLLSLLVIGPLTAQVETVATGVDFIQDVALDENNRLYAADVSVVIHSVDLGQGIPAELNNFLAVENPRGLVVIEDYLYYSTDGENVSILRVPLSGSSTEPETVIGELPPGTPLEFLTVGNEVYVAFVNTLDDGGIYRFELDQPFPQQLDTVITGFPVSGMAIYNDELYFTYFNSLPIQKIDPFINEPTPEIVVPELVGPNGLTVVGDNIYVSTESTISRFDLTTPLPALEAVATNLSLPSRMAFDGNNYLYFGEGSRIARLFIPTAVAVRELSDLGASVYPNPTSGLLYLQGIDVVKLVVTDLLGRRVLEVANPGNRLDISNLPTGIYSLLLETTNAELAIVKVSKQ